ITDTSHVQIVYNGTNEVIEKALPYVYKGFSDDVYNGSITLQPWTSQVLFYLSGSGEDIPPTVDAGSNQTISLPTNNVTVTGNVTQGTNSIASYAWTKQSGG